MERGWHSTFQYDRCLRIFNKVYENVNAFQLSADERKAKNIENDRTLIYGEVTFYNFVKVLEYANVQSREVFYDLGSGGGKAVFIAGLTFDLAKVCGIEKLDTLYELSTSLLVKLKNMPEAKNLLPDKQINIEFIHDDFMKVDISDADIVFINATCYSGIFWNDIVAKFHKLKVGTRIIITSQKIEEIGGFEQKYSNIHLMSWGMAYVTIYQRI